MALKLIPYTWVCVSFFHMRFSLIRLIYNLLFFTPCSFRDHSVLPVPESPLPRTCQFVNLVSRSSSALWYISGKCMPFLFFSLLPRVVRLHPASIPLLCQYLSLLPAFSPLWKPPFLGWKIDTFAPSLNMLSASLLPFPLFPRRETSRFSTTNASILYGQRGVSHLETSRISIRHDNRYGHKNRVGH